MKIHPLSVLAPISILLLMGVVSAVYDFNSESPISYLATPLMGGECMKCLEGKTVDLYHIATEHSRTPSNWCVEKGGPANVISFSQPYDVVRSSIKDRGSRYQVKMTLDDGNRVQDIQFFKNSVRVPTIPGGLWNIALLKLDAR
jgi:hypothetical protein